MELHNAEGSRSTAKVASKLVKGGSALERKGRCAVAANSGAIEGHDRGQRRRQLPGHARFDQHARRSENFRQGGQQTTVNFSAEFIDRKTNKYGEQLANQAGGRRWQKYRLVSNGRTTPSWRATSPSRRNGAAWAGERSAAIPTIGSIQPIVILLKRVAQDKDTAGTISCKPYRANWLRSSRIYEVPEPGYSDT